MYGPKGVEHPRAPHTREPRTPANPAHSRAPPHPRAPHTREPRTPGEPSQLTMFQSPKPISVVITLSIFWFAFRFTGLRFRIRSSSNVAFTRQ